MQLLRITRLPPRTSPRRVVRRQPVKVPASLSWEQAAYLQLYDDM